MFYYVIKIMALSQMATHLKTLEGIEPQIILVLTMAKKRELTREDRARVKALYDAGWSYRRIGRDLQCSPNTVKYTLDRQNVTNSHQNRKGRGRKKYFRTDKFNT